MRAHKIIFLNGPSRAGKDTAALALVKQRELVRVTTMKTPIDGALRGFFGVDDQTWHAWEDNKDVVSERMFNGQTLRKVKISFSEEWAKRKFGNDVFGQLALMRLRYPTAMRETVISDSGFLDEAIPLIEHFGVANCLLIQIHRDGYSFDGDSRSYWEYPNLTTVAIHNDHDLAFYEQHINRVVARWLKET